MRIDIRDDAGIVSMMLSPQRLELIDPGFWLAGRILTVEIRSIDLAGNESTPFITRVLADVSDTQYEYCTGESERPVSHYRCGLFNPRLLLPRHPDPPRLVAVHRRAQCRREATPARGHLAARRRRRRAPHAPVVCRVGRDARRRSDRAEQRRLRWHSYSDDSVGDHSAMPAPSCARHPAVARATDRGRDEAQARGCSSRRRAEPRGCARAGRTSIRPSALAFRPRSR